MTVSTPSGLILPHSAHTLERMLPARDLVLNTHGIRVALDYLGLKTLNSNRGALVDGMAWRSKSGLTVLGCLEDTTTGTLLHLSISRATRWPTWQEVHAVRDATLPSDMAVMMLLANTRDMERKSQRYAFDVWQMPPWGIRS